MLEIDRTIPRCESPGSRISGHPDAIPDDDSCVKNTAGGVAAYSGAPEPIRVEALEISLFYYRFSDFLGTTPAMPSI